MKHQLDDAIKELNEVCKKHNIKIMGNFGYSVNISSETHEADIDQIDSEQREYMYRDRNEGEWIEVKLEQTK